MAFRRWEVDVTGPGQCLAAGNCVRGAEVLGSAITALIFCNAVFVFQNIRKYPSLFWAAG
jgi:hypothetical protein